MNAVKRKRAKGGGAKPQGPYAEKRAVFSTRITQETRDRLEKLAPRTPLKNVSQLVEKLIVEGLDRWEGKRENAHIDALIAVLGTELRYIQSKHGNEWIRLANAQAEIAHVLVTQLARKLPGVHSITVAMLADDDLSVGSEIQAFASPTIAAHDFKERSRAAHNSNEGDKP